MYLHKNWTFQERDGHKWFPAAVPGCVHTDLLDNGLIDEPFYRNNEDKLQWIESVDWDYQTTFAVTQTQLQCRVIELVFEGLDTIAVITLNDAEIATTNNMFRTWQMDVKPHLRAGENILKVRFLSPITQSKPAMEKLPYTLPSVFDHRNTGPFVRKAPYQHGWDWGPRFVTCGIWKPVYLKFLDQAGIDNVQIIQNKISKEKADISVNVALRKQTTQELALCISEAGNAFDPVIVDLKDESTNVPVTIDFPDLWWPNGLGDPNLYHINVELLDGEQVIDYQQERIGLRTIELRQTKDDNGASFAFVVNGVPVFAKGGNWIPADSFINRVDEDVYSEQIDACVNANMNMLRVWGGGIYENDIFYDLCDEAGIMVWQDFVFSCAMYPIDTNFLDNVRQEAIDNIKRLRNHPSLVLWCGNNEIEWGWDIWGWKEKYPQSIRDDYDKLFEKLLPELCAEYDPTRTYWPSSPSSGDGVPAGDMAYGDTHYWDVWHGKVPFSTFETLRPRFVSEYGFQSFPEMATIDTFALPEDQDIASDVMTSHQKCGPGNHLILNYMLRHYNPPQDFESFVYLSQVLQAEGIKTGTEHFRRLMPYCMGALYWQINDCWPVVSWASLDYYGAKKALHHYAQHFFSPVLVSLQEQDDQLKVYVVSDKTDPIQATLRTRLYHLNGKKLKEETTDIEISPLHSAVYQSIDLNAWGYGQAPEYIFIKSDVLASDEILSTNRHYLLPVKELALKRPDIHYEVQRSGEGFIINLNTDTLAKNVYLTVPDDNGEFSDNYFDLQPDAPVSVKYVPEAPLFLWELRAQLNIKTLIDTF